jgi:serine protease
MCCTEPTCCTSSTCPPVLSIKVAPNPAIDGQRATINGTLTGGTVAAQPVDLWQRLPGHTAFTDVAQTQTSSSGSFQFVRPVQTDAKWYAKTGSVASATVDESVRARIALHPSTVPHGSAATVTLSGSIAPSHAGERVALEQRRGRRWVTIAHPKLGARSRFKVVRRLHGQSTWRFRVVLAPDARNARSVSAVVTVGVVA